MKKKVYIKAHTSFNGHTGYNSHARNFFTSLNKLITTKVRNFTACDDQQNYLTDEHKEMLIEQTLTNPQGQMEIHPFYSSFDDTEYDKIDIVLNETNHHYFYDNHYGRPRIAYNVWESTQQPQDFFDRLLTYDQLWVPTEWQRQCSIEQGYPADRVKVVTEGIDGNIYKPYQSWEQPITDIHPIEEYRDGRFKFILFGRWDYRKSIKEIIETFLKTFNKSEPIDLVISVDNPYSVDGLNSTEERLEHYGFMDERIKIKHFPPTEEYIHYMKTGNVFLSCARSEGWNIPLMEAMACGTPAIYSNWGAQLEFAEGIGHPVNIIGERPAKDGQFEGFNGDVPGNYCEPDFNHLSVVMRDVYENYTEYKQDAVKKSIGLRDYYQWDKIAQRAYNILEKDLDMYTKNVVTYEDINVSFFDGAKVEINGEDRGHSYEVTFIDKNPLADKNHTIIHQQSIPINCWVATARHHFTDYKIIVKRDGEQIFQYDLDLSGKRIYIHLDSKSLGDTLTWLPYVEEFRKKHNCDVVVSTFWNQFFEETYPNLEYAKPGEVIHNLFGQYLIGCWDDDRNRNPFEWRSISQQKIPCDILGLDYTEIKPKLKLGYERPMKEKYVCIAPYGTAKCKHWNNPTGWKKLVKWIRYTLGYKVILITKEQQGFMGHPIIPGVVDDTGNKPIERRMQYLEHAEFFIGIGSGLSWLAWACNTKTVMISGFSEDWCEFKADVRIINKDVCHGCWNNPEWGHFDRGDWEWCPQQKDFECTKQITSDMVIKEINDKIIDEK